MCQAGTQGYHCRLRSTYGVCMLDLCMQTVQLYTHVLYQKEIPTHTLWYSDCVKQTRKVTTHSRTCGMKPTAQNTKYAYIHIFMYIHTSLYTYTHTHEFTYAHTNTHTRTGGRCAACLQPRKLARKASRLPNCAPRACQGAAGRHGSDP